MNTSWVLCENQAFFKCGHLYQNLLCYSLLLFRSSHWKCSIRIGVLEKFAKFTGKHHTCACVSFLIKLQAWCLQLYLKKETLTQVFSCKFCESFKSTFFTEHLRVIASDFLSYDEVLLFSLLVGCYHDIVFMVPVNAYLKSKLLVEEQFSLKSKIKFCYACLI